jgi:hypothetical protein
MPVFMPVYRPASIPSVSSSHRAGRTDPQDLKIPFHVDVRPKPLPGTAQRPAFESPTEISSQPAMYPNRWRGGELLPGYPWYPSAWYQSGCYPGYGAWGPWGLWNSPTDLPPQTDVTIGSLVDGRASLSSPSYSSAPSAYSGGVATSSPVSLQYGFQSSPCGAPASFVGF